MLPRKYFRVFNCIEGVGFAPEELGINQSMAVIINGKRDREIALVHMKPQSYCFEFHLNKVDKQVVVTLEFGARKSPFELGIGSSRLRYGFGISKFRLSKSRV